MFSPQEWEVFLDGVIQGEFTRPKGPPLTAEPVRDAIDAWTAP